MQLISKFKKGLSFLLCVIDIFSKYAWVIPLRDKISITITNAFQKVLKESDCKPNKIWVDKGSAFYNRSIKSCLEKNAIEMYSRHNQGKSVVAERFLRILRNKIYKFTTLISKNVYIDKLDDKVDKCNNSYHKTITMKLFNVKPSTYIDFSNEINNEDHKYKIGDIVRISTYKSVFFKRLCSKLDARIFCD